MKFSTLHIKQKHHLQSTLPKYICAFFILFALSYTNAQDVTESLKNSVDSLIKTAPKTYSEIDAVLRPIRKDTVAMRFFRQKRQKKTIMPGRPTHSIIWAENTVIFRNSQKVWLYIKELLK
ncbi:hypothetical protein [Maribacter halichondriae]|uniref:hypothetical protein n=1 Tax=Maribacter halichondriae TaxID=2980554 RepID=UPI002358E560|nr:hypothetical protein [Maribacter sp. Hal144]